MSAEILTPPNSHDDEHAVLGSILHDPRCLDVVARYVSPDDFYSNDHALIFGAMLAMQSASKPIDTILLRNWLKDAGECDAAGGPEHIAEMLQSVPYAAHAAHYAATVKRLSVRRSLIRVATDMVRNAWNQTMPEADVLCEADRALTEIIITGNERDGWTATEAMIATTENIDETIAKGATTGMATGFRTFDEEIGGLFPGELSILGARSSVGKTAFAMQVAQWNASKNRLVYFVTLEMSMLNLMTRELCAEADVNSTRLRTGRIDANERERLMEAARVISTRSIVIDDRVSMKSSDIMRKARQLARQGLKLVIVDYTQFVQPEDSKAVREQQVARISKDLKAIAKELKVAVLALSALNKEAEKQGSAKLSHIRESEGVSYTADVVMTLERGEKGTDKENEAWLKVIKNRNGPTGKFSMDWIPHRTRFACKDETPPDPASHLPTNRDTSFDAYGGTDGF